MAQCFYPRTLGVKAPGGAGYYTDLKGRMIPCGRCIGCRMNHARSWATRIAHEATLHEENSFLTLTYNDQCLPSDGSLSKREFQLFMKRLRFALEPKQLRFFGCGEYGGSTQRPHYHLILFGHSFSEDRRLLKQTAKGDYLYTSPFLDKTWGLGYGWIGDVNTASAGYVAQYALKKANAYHQPKSIYHEEEFLLMSRRPGIGAGWWDKYASDAFPSDFVVIDGRKLPVPLYYKRKVQEQDKADGKILPTLHKVDEKRREHAAKQDNSLIRKQTRWEILAKRLNDKEREPDDS